MCRENQHLFCRACITRHLTNSQTCPTCMQKLRIDTLTQAPRAVTNFLCELTIRCDFYDRGCVVLIELGDLENHLKECGFAPVVCSNAGCELVVNQRDLVHHESAVCEQRRVKCHNCAELQQEMDTVKTTLAEMNKKLDDIQDKFAIQNKFESMEKQQEKLSRHEFEDTKFKVVVAGGWNKDSSQLNSVELFDSSRRTWSYLQPMKECRKSASAFVYNNQIIVSGGWTKSNRRPLRTNSMEALQNANQISPLSTWKNFPAKLSGKLSGFSTVVYNDSLIVVGGITDDSYSANISEVSLVHPYTIKMLTKMPRSMGLHAVELFGDKIVIIGGRKTRCINNVLMYDIKKNKCEELAPLPYPVQNVATVKWADNVIVIGGQERDFMALNTVIIYNIKSQKSHWLPPMIYKRSACTAAVVDNTIIVMGGEDEKENILNSVERFSFTHYTWEELPSMHEARKAFTSVAC
ncbi:RING finger 151-like [Paramuricea clavata]|uniref:RING finger 151-like n=1 Tax=Paramuricea clavata TaxID=317549 RepID=A0A7D9J4X7_PARCT|nr:RING finger 151-like [Paramuricea clavata]